MTDFINWHNENIRDLANVPGFQLAAAAGEIEGVTTNFKFGRVTSTGTVEEVIWDGAGEYKFLPTAEPLTVVSDDATDSSIETIELTANPTDGQTMVISVSGVNQTITFADTPATGEVEIGVDEAATAASLAAELGGTAVGAVVTLPSGTNYVSSESAMTLVQQVGAWSVMIYGLDENYEEITETVLLEGTTAVTTTQEFIRVYRAIVLTSGTNSATVDANVGTITIAPETTTTSVQAKILPHIGQTLMCVYTVPAGKSAYVTGIGFSIGKAKDAMILAKLRIFGENSSFQTKYTTEVYESNETAPLQIPFYVPEKTDIVLNVLPGASGSRVSASFGFYLIANV